MNQQTDKAILVVSFGTSYEASRKATIEKIEQDIRNAFQDHRIYRAWTSKFIISILKKRDNYTVLTVKEALEQMITDGIREVVVQPTHILDGIENNIMKEEVLLKNLLTKSHLELLFLQIRKMNHRQSTQ